MGRIYFLTIYLFTLLICACSINKAFAEVKESKKIHQLTTLKYVVKVSCSGGHGSGVIINGKVLTAAHVVGDSFNCVITDYQGFMYQSYPELLDEQKDLALLKTDIKLRVNGIRLAKHNLNKYDEIYTIGFPLSLEYVLTKGSYQFTHGQLDYNNVPVMLGNSGGGMFCIQDGEIRLVGIVHALATYKKYIVNHLSMSIKLDTIKEFINGRN